MHHVPDLAERLDVQVPLVVADLCDAREAQRQLRRVQQRLYQAHIRMHLRSMPHPAQCLISNMSLLARKSHARIAVPSRSPLPQQTWPSSHNQPKPWHGKSNYLMQGYAHLGCEASRAEQHAFDAHALHAEPNPAGALLPQQDVTAVVAAHSVQTEQAVSCGVARHSSLGRRAYLDHDGILGVCDPDVRPHFGRVLDDPVAGGHARVSRARLHPEGTQLVCDVRKLRLGEPAAHSGGRRTSEHTAMLAKPRLTLYSVRGSYTDVPLASQHSRHASLPDLAFRTHQTAQLKWTG